MPDICMCSGVSSGGEKCPQKNSCYRYTAEPNPYRQSYFMVAPFVVIETTTDQVTITETECVYFSPTD